MTGKIGCTRGGRRTSALHPPRGFCGHQGPEKEALETKKVARAIPGATGYSHSRESCREGAVDPWNALSKSAGAINGRAIPYTARESRCSKQLTWACQVASFSIQNHSHWAKDEELCSDDPSILGVVRTHAKEHFLAWCGNTRWQYVTMRRFKAWDHIDSERPNDMIVENDDVNVRESDDFQGVDVNIHEFD